MPPDTTPPGRTSTPGDGYVNDGWGEYRRWVVESIAELKMMNRELLESVQKVDRRLLVIEIKAGIWGLIAGGLVSAAIALLRSSGYILVP